MKGVHTSDRFGNTQATPMLRNRVRTGSRWVEPTRFETTPTGLRYSVVESNTWSYKYPSGMALWGNETTS